MLIGNNYKCLTYPLHSLYAPSRGSDPDHYAKRVPLPSSPVLSRCSERSHPNTRSLSMPLFLSFPLAGRDRMKLRKNEMSLPCFRSTGLVGSEGESSDDSVSTSSPPEPEEVSLEMPWRRLLPGKKKKHC